MSLKRLSLIVLFLSFSSIIYSGQFPDIIHGFSLGRLGGSTVTEDSGGALSIDLLGYRFLEKNSGLGASFYLFPLYSVNHQQIDDFSLEDVISMELNWEPFNKKEGNWGYGLFHRIDYLVPGGRDFNWLSGVRIDFRFETDNFFYSLGAVEAGYNYHNGLYFAVKLEAVVLAAGGIIGLLSRGESAAYDTYPDIVEPIK